MPCSSPTVAPLNRAQDRATPRTLVKKNADTQCLADVPEDERCHCKHEPVDGNPNMYEVKPKNADVSNHSVV